MTLRDVMADDVRRLLELRRSRTQKYCPRCQQTKPVEEFSPSKYRGDGRMGYCKACERERSRQRRVRGRLRCAMCGAVLRRLPEQKVQ